MAEPYIRHITLATTSARRSSRAEVHDGTLAIVVPWLAEKNIALAISVRLVYI